LAAYRPETKVQKRARLLAEAKAIVTEQQKTAEEKKENPKATVKAAAKGKKPKFVKYGLKHVTALVESRKAKLVIIANDVDPLEVCWFLRFALFGLCFVVLRCLFLLFVLHRNVAHS
jgi:large subunit ribosomal protein L7Ae